MLLLDTCFTNVDGNSYRNEVRQGEDVDVIFYTETDVHVAEGEAPAEA